MLFATSYTSSLVDVTNLITTHSERNCVDLWFHMLGVRLINTLFTNHLPQWSDCLQVTHMLVDRCLLHYLLPKMMGIHLYRN